MTQAGSSTGTPTSGDLSLRLSPRLRRLFGRFRYHIWILEGKERVTHAPLELVYAGRPRNKAYFSHLAFDEPPLEHDRGIMWWPRARRLCAGGETGVPMTVIEKQRIPRFFPPRASGLIIPAWVDGILELSDARRNMRENRDVKNDLRKMRKSGFTVAVAPMQDKLDFFYHRMYAPYISHAHGGATALAGYSWVKKKAAHGELLLVLLDGRTVAGEFILYEKNQAGAVLIGVLNGDSKYLKLGVTGALYYYRIQHLARKGFQRVRLGASRAFIHDGVLQYKKKWGVHLTGQRKEGFLIGLLRETAGVRAFLRHNPFIVAIKDRMTRVAFVENGEECVVERLLGFDKDLRMPGAPDLRVFYFQGSLPDETLIAIPGGSIRVESAKPLFKPV